jgi:GrpB-like predicted nucleotidyltransferase (UPF0157 family)
MHPDAMKKRPYSIQEYNPDWVVKFESIKKFLEEVFKEKAIHIEHVGSTSIPGIKAKPVIDVAVLVNNIEPFTEERKQMYEAGYKSIDNYIGPNTLIFYKEDKDQRKTENIHIWPKDHPKADRTILMRDYFRTHSDQVKKYQELKERLTKEFPDDYPAYRAGKDIFLDEIAVLSKEWGDSQ